MQINESFGFGAMATPNLDPGDAGYVGASTFVEPSRNVEAGVGIGAIVLVVIAAWLLFKR